MNLPNKLIQLNDKVVIEALKNQVDNAGSRYDGGIMDPIRCIPSPSHVGTPVYMASMVVALLTSESKFFQDLAVVKALDKATDYMLRMQHDDGTISLGSTNFHSPPDTAFIVTGFVHMYNLLNNSTWKNLHSVATKIKTFLKRTIPALLTGGCHTPNHRWVMTAALGALYQVFPKEDLVERAEEWMAEGIDITEDGEWTERSNGIYNVVSNINFFYISKYLNRPHMLDYVRKNLEMMIYMVHPNGDVVTEYSVRQDIGGKFNLSGYFLLYQLMADHDRDKKFAAMADLAMENIDDLGSVNNHVLLTLLTFPTNIDDLERDSLPKNYTKVFNENHPVEKDLKRMEKVGHHSKVLHTKIHTEFGSPVLRYRNNQTSMTLMTRNPTFFSLRHGGVNLLGISISTAFTPGIVELENFEVIHNRYKMRTIMEKGYNSPISRENLPESAYEESSPWYLLPHQLRSLTHVQKHTMDVEVCESEDGFNIHLKSNDHKDVMTQILFFVSKDNSIRGVNQISGRNDTYFWPKDKMIISSGEDWIEISEGQLDHKIQPNNIPFDQHNIQTVVVNLYAPFDKKFHIKLSNE